METFYLLIVGFIFIIAVFVLWVGASNDAVNFLNSAIGAKAAPYKVIMGVAALGIFVGSAMSNGMMDIARHGIYQPQFFYMNEVMCILLSVMLTNVVLLDIFNTLGLPTSTTVSMVFALLGGTFAMTLVKIFNTDGALVMGDLINTDKALQMIFAIFVSVAIAFVFGVVVQYLARLIFKFNYTKQMKYFGSIFCGFAATSIVYFILIKGLKGTLSPGQNEWIQQNTTLLMGGCFAFFTVLMQILAWCKINILKVVVLLGTFALALAFAGNDLVNFIGVPLAALASYQDFVALGNGLNPDEFLMTSLLGSATTHPIFLIASGLIMVIALLTSKKVHNVIKTSLDLSRQDSGDETFGTSAIARRLVRMTTNTSSAISNAIPAQTRAWINGRFDKDEAILEHGAAFDLIRAAINLVLASLLIALGTSLKLPLSTTYVTFMVAMGSSLADRAWGRESAVYRITGVISVIGGWFITAGAAFLICFLVAAIIHFGGAIAIILLGALAGYMLIHSQIAYNKKQKQVKESTLAQQVVANKDQQEALVLLRRFSQEEFDKALDWSADLYGQVTNGFLNESYRTLRKAMNRIDTERLYFKQVKRVGTIGVSHLNDQVGLEKGLYYYQGNDFAYDIIHAIKRICEPCLEHIDNNFNPLELNQKQEFGEAANEIVEYLRQCRKAIKSGETEGLRRLYDQGNRLINHLGVLKREEIRQMREQVSYIKVEIVYLTVIQESQNVVAYAINLLKMNQKFQEN